MTTTVEPEAAGSVHVRRGPTASRYWRIRSQYFALFLGLQASCSPEALPGERVQAARPKLVAQRVTATVKREAARLVHIRTEHEALVTTPEHPFATAQAGWIPAGRWLPGDRVVSAMFGTVRILAVQQEKPAEPQRVFNLTVEPSHTYVVGADQVLVHNGKCKDLAETEKELEAALRELESLELQHLIAASEDRSTLQQQIAEARSHIRRLRASVYRRRAAARRKNAQREPGAPAPASAPAVLRTGALERAALALDTIEREMKALRGTTGAAGQRLAGLQVERRKVKKRLGYLRIVDKKERGIARLTVRARLLRAAEEDYESRTRSVEAAQRELSVLLGEELRSDAEKKSHEERRAALEKKLEALQLEQGVSKTILDGERRITELSGRSPGTDAEREQLAAEQRELGARLSKLRTSRRSREAHRRLRSDPKVWAEKLETGRQRRRKSLRTAAYEADTERPRDELDLLEAELAARRRSGAESFDERTEELAEHVATLRKLVELSRERAHLHNTIGFARARRAALAGEGKDTQKIEQKITRLVQARDANRVHIVQLRLRGMVLGRLDGTASRDAPDESDETRLREFERELEGEPAAGGQLGEERLREIQQELGETELIDAEFLESIWREAEVEAGASRLTVQDDAADLDGLLRELLESSERRSSPEGATVAESGREALLREMWEERSAVEAADLALANEQASLSQTLGRPGSSRYAASERRVAELQQQRLQLRTDWRARMQHRLDAAVWELRTIQSIERVRDEATEAELAERIAVIEQEVNNPSF